MIDPIVIGEVKDYVSKMDKSDNPTVWLIGSLDSIQKAKISSMMVSVQLIEGNPQVVQDKDIFMNYSDFVVVSYGLKGWKNFGSIEFKTEKKVLFGENFDVIPFETLKQIPLDIIRELAAIIWEDNSVNETLAKN